MKTSAVVQHLNLLIRLLLAACFVYLMMGTAWAAAKKGKANSLDGVVAPGENDNMKELKGELLIASSEAKAIQQLKRLIAKHKGSSMEPGLPC
jgi:hypothetical protein